MSNETPDVPKRPILKLRNSITTDTKLLTEDVKKRWRFDRRTAEPVVDNRGRSPIMRPYTSQTTFKFTCRKCGYKVEAKLYTMKKRKCQGCRAGYRDNAYERAMTRLAQEHGYTVTGFEDKSIVVAEHDKPMPFVVLRQNFNIRGEPTFRVARNSVLLQTFLYWGDEMPVTDWNKELAEHPKTLHKQFGFASRVRIDIPLHMTVNSMRALRYDADEKYVYLDLTFLGEKNIWNLKRDQQWVNDLGVEIARTKRPYRCMNVWPTAKMRNVLQPGGWLYETDEFLLRDIARRKKILRIT